MLEESHVVLISETGGCALGGGGGGGRAGLEGGGGGMPERRIQLVSRARRKRDKRSGQTHLSAGALAAAWGSAEGAASVTCGPAPGSSLEILCRLLSRDSFKAVPHPV
jgi:hypothetical protein